jgi:hypothetical protein
MILVKGEPMLSYPLSLAKKAVHPVPIVICPYELQNTIARMHCTALPVVFPQPGPALSLLCANGYVNEADPVVVMMCDDIIDPNAFQDFVIYSRRMFSESQNLNGHINAVMLTTTVEDGSAAWSFVQSGSGTNVTHVVEKMRISNRVSCGVFAFRSWALLRQAICKMVAEERYAVNGEFFVAPVINFVRGFTRYFDIPPNCFNTVGSPEQLAAYLQRSATNASQ